MKLNQKKQCYFCAANVTAFDYKDDQFLWKFLTPQAQISRRRKSGTCSLHQRRLAEVIKRARFMGFLPYTTR